MHDNTWNGLRLAAWRELNARGGLWCVLPAWLVASTLLLPWVWGPERRVAADWAAIAIVMPIVVPLAAARFGEGDTFWRGLVHDEITSTIGRIGTQLTCIFVPYAFIAARLWGADTLWHGGPSAQAAVLAWGLFNLVVYASVVVFRALFPPATALMGPIAVAGMLGGLAVASEAVLSGWSLGAGLIVRGALVAVACLVATPILEARWGSWRAAVSRPWRAMFNAGVRPHPQSLRIRWRSTRSTNRVLPTR